MTRPWLDDGDVVSTEAELGALLSDLGDALEHISRLKHALESLADIHHRTLTNSRLHDPERIDSFRDCPCKTCATATAVLAVLSSPVAERGER